MDPIYGFMIGAGGGYAALQIASNLGLDIDAGGFVMGSIAVGFIVGGWVGLAA